MTEFRCLLVKPLQPDAPPGSPTELVLTTQPAEALPPGEVTIQVSHSSLNYKDAMASRGHPGVVKRLPHIPGIDAAGVVLESSAPQVNAGDPVLVTGYDLGQGHWGGWSELIRVPATWVVPLPPTLSARQAMSLGTAGFTAAQSVLALQQHDVLPGSGPVVVTGATGGVGSLAVRMLAQLGYEVTAITGKAEQHAALRQAGASQIMSRHDIQLNAHKPLLSAQWAGGIDTVGGDLLPWLLRGCQYGGCVTACGLVAGSDLAMSVYPFLLRGVSLCGIASADCPRERRERIWQLLSQAWKLEDTDSWVTDVDWQELPHQIERMLDGQVVGRTVLHTG